MEFNPELCRNESEVESKFIVQYLLPKLGYSPDSWHQEVALGSIRLDFLLFATQIVPFSVNENSPISVVIEAKAPKQNLNHHIGRLKRYLIKLNIRYGLLTNGKNLRIFEKIEDDIHLVFECSGIEVEAKLDEIKSLIGKNELSSATSKNSTEFNFLESQILTFQSSLVEQPKNSRRASVKIIAVYHNKGGVGKTTTVINLAAAIRKKGKKVLIIDLDSQANTTFAVGLAKFEDEQQDTLKDSNIYHVINSRSRFSISEVARKSQFTNPEIDVIPCHISLMHYEKTFLEVDAAKTRLVSKLKEEEDKYDVVIIDTPPSLNLYAMIALITADYLIIPSDLKPFANEGLINVKNFIQETNEFRTMIGKSLINLLGVLPSKISTNSRFVQHTLPKREALIKERYDLPLIKTRIFEREDLAKSVENTITIGDLEIPDPRSVMDYKPDSQSATEFEKLAIEIMKRVGIY